MPPNIGARRETGRRYGTIICPLTRGEIALARCKAWQAFKPGCQKCRATPLFVNETEIEIREDGSMPEGMKPCCGCGDPIKETRIRYCDECKERIKRHGEREPMTRVFTAVMIHKETKKAWRKKCWARNIRTAKRYMSHHPDLVDVIVKSGWDTREVNRFFRKVKKAEKEAQ